MKTSTKRQEISQRDEDPLHVLCEAVALLKNAQEAKDFLHDLCTPAELQEMAGRWRVVEPLKQGKPYRKIHEETGVSVTTIGRVARFIEHGNGGYQLIYQRRQKRKNVTTSAPQNRRSKEGSAQ